VSGQAELRQVRKCFNSISRRLFVLPHGVRLARGNDQRNGATALVSMVNCRQD
jgi:hypothetical protein